MYLRLRYKINIILVVLLFSGCSLNPKVTQSIIKNQPLVHSDYGTIGIIRHDAYYASDLGAAAIFGVVGLLAGAEAIGEASVDAEQSPDIIFRDNLRTILLDEFKLIEKWDWKETTEANATINIDAKERISGLRFLGPAELKPDEVLEKLNEYSLDTSLQIQSVIFRKKTANSNQSS